jgi:endonuclease/exonuclease/phosphatase family metal-dependent hydrolase
MAVVTWNMNAGRGDLPALLSDLTAGRLGGGVPGAYVLLLQEAVEGNGDPEPTLGRVRPLELSTFFSAVREFDGRIRGNAILSSLPLTATRVIALPRERQPRAAVAASLSLHGQPLFVVSVHLENRVSWLRGGLFSDGARGRQAAALMAALPPDEPGIVGGDLNTWLGPTEPAWRMLLMRFPDTPHGVRVDATFRDRLALDHLFFQLPEGWEGETYVVADKYGSDHHPVVAEIFRR